MSNSKASALTLEWSQPEMLTHTLFILQFLRASLRVRTSLLYFKRDKRNIIDIKDDIFSFLNNEKSCRSRVSRILLCFSGGYSYGGNATYTKASRCKGEFIK